MQLTERETWGRPLVAAFVVCAFHVTGAFSMPTSMTTSTATPSQWHSVLETTRLFVSLRLNETTAIIAVGVIIGLAAASFAVFGFDWRDYDQGPSHRLIIEEDQGVQVSAKHADA